MLDHLGASVSLLLLAQIREYIGVPSRPLSRARIGTLLYCNSPLCPFIVGSWCGFTVSLRAFFVGLASLYALICVVYSPFHSLV